MAFKFTAGKPEQKTFTPVPAGDYDFEILEAAEEVTDGGSQYLALKLRVADTKGNKGIVFDKCFLSEKAFWKIDSLLMSIGQHPGEGVLIEIEPGDVVGAMGRASVKRVEISRKDGAGVLKPTGEYKNEIGSYLWDENAPPRKRTALDSARDARTAKPAETPTDEPTGDEDDIPF